MAQRAIDGTSIVTRRCWDRQTYAHGLVPGQVGTVVAILDGACEVEFSDDESETYAELALAPDQLLVLHHRTQQAA